MIKDIGKSVNLLEKNIRSKVNLIIEENKNNRTMELESKELKSIYKYKSI